MIVIEQADQVEVFANTSGGITIKQGDGSGVYLIGFPVGSAKAVIAGIKQAVKDAKGE